MENHLVENLKKYELHTPAPFGLVRAARAEIEMRRRESRTMSISVEAMAEIKATVDGNSTQTVRDIVYGALAEIEALSTHTSAEGE